MNDLGIWDCFSVKAQVYKTAVETSMLLLRIDDIVSGTKKASGADAGPEAPAEVPMAGGE